MPEHDISTYWHDRLDRIEMDCREKGWDSYSAAPVTETAIKTAKRLCYSLDVVPMNDGGVQVSLSNEGVCIEIGPDGKVGDVFLSSSDVTHYVKFDAI